MTTEDERLRGILELQRLGHFLIACAGAFFGSWAIIVGTEFLYGTFFGEALICERLDANLCTINSLVAGFLQIPLMFLLCLMPIIHMWHGQKPGLVWLVGTAATIGFFDWLLIFGSSAVARAVSDLWFLPAALITSLLLTLAMMLWQRVCFRIERSTCLDAGTAADRAP